MSLTIILLGSGQDGGVPQFGARSPVDHAARTEPRLRRLGPSLAALTADGRTLLVDASPDLKLQETCLLTEPEYVYRDRRVRNPFDAIILTHAHMGHYAGLVHFGREAANTQELPCHVTPSMAAFLRRHAPWEQLVRLGNLVLHELSDEAIELWSGLAVRAVPVPHRGEYTDTIGVSIGGRLLYVPDIDSWEAWPAARDEITRHEICLLDGTFFSTDELDGRDPDKVPHPPVVDTIERFADLADGRRLILTHMNHTNPLCDHNSSQARRAEAAGFEIAAEMMRFEL